MEKYYAHAFYRIARTLETMSRLSTANVADTVPTDDFLERDSGGLKTVVKMCQSIGLTFSAMYAQRLSEEIAPGKKITFS